MAFEKPKFGAKSEFVRSLDPSIPVAEVVALAEKSGMKLTPGLVYNIRSAAGVTLRREKVATKVSRRKALLENGMPEAQLRAAIAQVGLSRAREILEEVEATFAGR
jgi:hypothetical protein